MVSQGMPDREYELEQLSRFVDEALDRAGKCGADAVEASASLHAGLNVNVRLGEVETLEHNRDRGISVTVYLNRSKGHATSADLQPGSVENCVQRAVEIARYTQEDKYNGLADPQRLASRDLLEPAVQGGQPQRLLPHHAGPRAGVHRGR